FPCTTLFRSPRLSSHRPSAIRSPDRSIVTVRSGSMVAVYPSRVTLRISMSSSFGYEGLHCPSDDQYRWGPLGAQGLSSEIFTFLSPEEVQGPQPRKLEALT